MIHEASQSMDEWQETTLSNLLKEPVRNGIYKKKEFHGRGVKIVNMGELFAYPRLKDINMKRVELTQSEKNKCLLIKGDLIFARRSLTAEGAGKCSIVKEVSEETTFESSIIRARPNPLKATPDFLYYYFNSPYGKYLLSTILRQVAVAGITGSDLMGLILKVPDITEQKTIAAILSSLDDKIDLLHRQNLTLEAMAETLFRQWFIEEAQEDWEEKSLLDLVELVGGGTPKTSMNEYWNGEIPWLSGGDIATNHKGFVSASEKTITKAGLDNSSAKLLPKFATVISARGTVGKYCLLANNMAFSQSNYGILPRIEGCYYFTYLLVNHVVEELQSAAYGSVFDTITTSTFRDARFTIPPTDKILAFENFISNYFGKKLLNQTQIHTLEKLRDTLLPKLMSGEVRVTP